MKLQQHDLRRIYPNLEVWCTLVGVHGCHCLPRACMRPCMHSAACLTCSMCLCACACAHVLAMGELCHAHIRRCPELPPSCSPLLPSPPFHPLPSLPACLQVIPSNFQMRGMHTILRDASTSTADFVFYADRLLRLVSTACTAHAHLPAVRGALDMCRCGCDLELPVVASWAFSTCVLVRLRRALLSRTPPPAMPGGGGKLGAPALHVRARRATLGGACTEGGRSVCSASYDAAHSPTTPLRCMPRTVVPDRRA